MKIEIDLEPIENFVTKMSSKARRSSISPFLLMSAQDWQDQFGYTTLEEVTAHINDILTNGEPEPEPKAPVLTRIKTKATNVKGRFARAKAALTAPVPEIVTPAPD